MAVKVEKAKEDDVEFLAKMILQSSRADKKIGLFDYLFETSEDILLLQKLQQLILNPNKCYCHYKNFLIARVEEKAVGTLCSYEPRVATKEKFVLALKEIGCDESVLDRLNVLDVCEFDINKRTLMFDFLEELEGYIDVGILKQLMQKSLLDARLKGYRVAQTIVEIGSLETLLFYEKLGFTQKEQRKCEVYQEIFGRVGVMLLAQEF